MARKQLILAIPFLLSCEEEPPTHRVFVAQGKQTLATVVVQEDCVRAFATDGREDWAYYSFWSQPWNRLLFGQATLEDEDIKLSFNIQTLKGKFQSLSATYDLDFEEVEAPAGVFTASTVFQDRLYTGGWIFAPSGEYRGALEINGKVLPAHLDSWDQRSFQVPGGPLLKLQELPPPQCPPMVSPGGSGGNGGGGGGNGGGGGGSGSCCKVCGPDSKPCGDSCIRREFECHQSWGCAC